MARPPRRYLRAISPVIVSASANIAMPANAPMGNYIDSNFFWVFYEYIRPTDPTELSPLAKQLPG